MSTALAAGNHDVQTERFYYERAAFAAAVASCLQNLGHHDAFATPDDAWVAATGVRRGALEHETFAGVAAVLDVLHGRLDRSGTTLADPYVYNLTRIATRLAEVLVEGGVEDYSTLSAWQRRAFRLGTATETHEPIQAPSPTAVAAARGVLFVLTLLR